MRCEVVRSLSSLELTLKFSCIEINLLSAHATQNELSPNIIMEFATH